MASTLPASGGHRKKGTGVRAWLLVDATGQAQVIEAGKHAIMRRTGLPARDLRILDPLLSYPSTVLLSRSFRNSIMYDGIIKDLTFSNSVCNSL
jgi:hypothetical protein